MAGFLQIQPNQFPRDFQKISRIHFFKFQIFTRPAIHYQNAGEVSNVWRPTIFRVLADIYRAGMLTPEIIVILFTRGLPYVQCTENRLTCKNYIANYKIFQEHQLNSRRFPVFPWAISNSRWFTGVLNTLYGYYRTLTGNSMLEVESTGQLGAV